MDLFNIKRNYIEILKNLDVLTNVHAIKIEIMINFEYKNILFFYKKRFNIINKKTSLLISDYRNKY